MAKIILLVEDSKDDELLLKRILRLAAVENPVFVVADGEEALAYLRGEGQYADRETFPLPGILFLDLRLPRIDGRQILKYARTQPALKNMLSIVLTNYGEIKNINDAYALGAQSFLIKPITQADLENLIVHFQGPWIRSSSGGDKGKPDPGRK